MESVAICLVNYNGSRFLNDCVRALRVGSYTNIEVVVVDNASTDQSVASLRSEFPDVTVLPQGQNIGVAAGNNVAIKYALGRGHDYVLLLNYDTLPDRFLIERLIEHGNERTLVTANTSYWQAPEVSNSHAGGFDWRLGRLRETFLNRTTSEIGASAREVDIADTCCLLVHRDVFLRVGFMDESYFLYYDDTDFVVRARTAGYRIVFVPSAVLRHYERGANTAALVSAFSAYYTTRNRLYFMRKHRPSRLSYATFLGYFAITRLIHMAKHVVTGRTRLAYWTGRGIADYLRGRMGHADDLVNRPPRVHGVAR